MCTGSSQWAITTPRYSTCLRPKRESEPVKKRIGGTRSDKLTRRRGALCVSAPPRERMNEFDLITQAGVSQQPVAGLVGLAHPFHDAFRLGRVFQLDTNGAIDS